VRRQDCFIRSQTYHPQIPKSAQNGENDKLKSVNKLLTKTEIGNDTIEVAKEKSKNESMKTNGRVRLRGRLRADKDKDKVEKAVAEKPFCPSERHCRNIPVDCYVSKWFNVQINVGAVDGPVRKEWFTGTYVRLFLCVCVCMCVCVCVCVSLSVCRSICLCVSISILLTTINLLCHSSMLTFPRSSCSTSYPTPPPSLPLLRPLHLLLSCSHYYYYSCYSYTYSISHPLLTLFLPLDLNRQGHQSIK
jgi:hypothetical protein